MATPARLLTKEVTSGFTQIEKLNASNWWAWKTRITTLYTLYDYMKYIDGSYPRPTPAEPTASLADKAAADSEIKTWELEDLHARHLLQIASGIPN
jgi:hypothetical protein